VKNIIFLNLCLLCNKIILRYYRDKLVIRFRQKFYPFYAQESEAPQGLGGAMISAVKRGCVEAVSQLLLQGAPLNVKDSVRNLLFILLISKDSAQIK